MTEFKSLPGDPPPEPKERGDLDDKQKIGRKETWERLQTRQQNEDVAFVLSSPEGRRFYWRLLKRCGIFKSSYSSEEGRIFFYEGERNIGLMLLKDVNEIAPDAYLLMLKEEKERETKER